MTLKELQIGKSAIVDAVGGAGALRQHFLDMGLIPGHAGKAGTHGRPHGAAHPRL